MILFSPHSPPGTLARRFLSLFLLSLAAVAQTTQASRSKEVQFEVLSIRPMNSSIMAPLNTYPSPNGFDSRLTLFQAIILAYAPNDPGNFGSVEVLKAPGWIGDFYDIKGRMS
jgi:hypothetical protein